jgi:hypothetical protein
VAFDVAFYKVNGSHAGLLDKFVQTNDGHSEVLPTRQRGRCESSRRPHRIWAFASTVRPADSIDRDC